MRKLILPVSVLLVPIIGACSISSSEISDAKMCERTVLEYADFRDDPNKASEYGALFTEDGTFTLGPNTVTGREALISRHKSANKTTIFNHVMDDIQISSDLTGKSRVVVYTKSKETKDDINRVIIADYIDRYEITNNRCLISDRKVAVVYDTNSARIIPAK